MATLVPYLTFRSPQSVTFLVDGLGFEVTARQDGEDGAILHAEFERGDAQLMGGSGDLGAGGSPGLYLVVDDVDAVYERALAAGGQAVHPPHDTEWGSRRARLTDPDGVEWSLGSYQPGQG